jgi:zinc and cadmium transporter
MLVELFFALTLISLISFIGVFTIKFNQKKMDNWIEIMVAFAIGALIGDVFIHLLPEVIEQAGTGIFVSTAILSGVVTFFILEKIIHWQHCHHTKHGAVCHRFTYMSLIGDVVHNFIDGVILASAFIASPVIGVSTTIAIILHEVPQEIGDFAVLIKGGFTRQKALLYNFFSALTAFVGAIFALIFANTIAGTMPFMMAFAAGSFLYIAGTDLFPELHKEFAPRQAILQLVFIILGILVMASLLLLE